ncbi:MAG: TauD/TfdA family dioxygenase [Betaproteobacteria bacterium]|nr:TauD/TfdA family dioxygenase [Betaproteobacteria bacterium]
MPDVANRLTVKPLHPVFVAEITGIDLTQPVSRDDLQVIWDAFNEHQILVFRDQRFDDEAQMRFSRYFGTLEMMEAHPANNYNPGHISVMTNLDADGNLMPLDHPVMVHRERNEAWHTDSSFKPIGALCSMLHARIVPPIGGNTEFASARAAYAALAPERKAAVAELKAIHRVTAPDEPHDTKAYLDEAKKRLTVIHPVVRTNPANGKKNLYVGAHAQEILGMPPQEGRVLLEELTAFTTQAQFVYSHPWRVHDLVIWDNRCALHRATTFEKNKYRRKLHRTTVAGTMPESVLARVPETMR